VIIKSRDSKEADINELIFLLSLPLTEKKRFLIERELRFMKSGDRGENDSAYYIDFIYSASTNWAVIHDLRLEFDGKVAQIDHLLINRFFDFYVLETKNFSYLVKITEDGEFLVEYKNKYYAIESPIEQNKRHIHLLEDLLDERQIMPTRIGLRIAPSFKNYVLVSAKARVIRPPRKIFDTSMLIKADTLETTIMDNAEHISNISALASVSKTVSRDVMLNVAEKIAQLHRPAKINYRKRFGIEDKTTVSRLTSQAGARSLNPPAKEKTCPHCGAPMVVRVAKKGAHANEPFWGCINYPNCKTIVSFER
jgi:Nuclease-related domain/Topoisomerase DNA binding C4 zinc finger